MSCCPSDEPNTSASKAGCAPKYRGVFCILGLLLVPIIPALLIHDGLQTFRTGDRYVSVRGLATRDVTADLAVWSIRHAATSNVLDDARKQLETDSAAIRTFLVEQGIPADGVNVLSIDSQDLMAQQYRPDNIQNGRYVLTETLVVRSNDVDGVNKAAQNVNLLLAKGVVLSNTGAPTYLFTKLNDIKPAMIADATKNARAGAEQFAQDSGQTVGSIRSASQGYFEIQARDPVNDIPETAQRYKTVRVVTSIDYYLR